MQDVHVQDKNQSHKHFVRKPKPTIIQYMNDYK